MKFATVFSMLFLAFGVTQSFAEEANSMVYELRTYHTNEGKLPALHARFRDHTIELFEDTDVLVSVLLQKPGRTHAGRTGTHDCNFRLL